MSKAVERARRVMGLYGENSAAYIALSDLLAEIDAGVWLDTRELAALGSVDLAINNARSGARAPLWVVTRFSEPGGSWVALTAVDAVRAAREATDA